MKPVAVPFESLSQTLNTLPGERTSAPALRLPNMETPD